MANDVVSAAAGRPLPSKAVTLITRVCQVAVLCAVLVWVTQYLGGLGFTPQSIQGDPNNNDTGRVFNWHPVLMTLAFPLLMGEALLSYKAPLLQTGNRSRQKTTHASLQAVALLSIFLGVVAAYKSHTLKKPVPVPNFYSPHSWVGVTIIVLACVQFISGFVAYLYPKVSPQGRLGLRPFHLFLGKAVFSGGLAAMMMGLQEKTAFVQLLAKPSVYAPVVRIPALTAVLLLAIGSGILFQHLPETSTTTSSRPGDGTDAEALLVDHPGRSTTI